MGKRQTKDLWIIIVLIIGLIITAGGYSFNSFFALALPIAFVIALIIGFSKII